MEEEKLQGWKKKLKIKKENEMHIIKCHWNVRSLPSFKVKKFLIADLDLPAALPINPDCWGSNVSLLGYIAKISYMWNFHHKNRLCLQFVSKRENAKIWYHSKLHILLSLLRLSLTVVFVFDYLFISNGDILGSNEIEEWDGTRAVRDGGRSQGSKRQRSLVATHALWLQ